MNEFIPLLFPEIGAAGAGVEITGSLGDSGAIEVRKVM